MPVLIDIEARENALSPLDIDRFSRRFKTNNDLFSFPDPNLETIDQNLFYLLRNSEEVEFKQEYKYRPDYMSFDYYGTTSLAGLIMYVNGIYSAEDFELVNVVMPSLDAITFILQDIFPIQDPEDLTGINW